MSREFYYEDCGLVVETISLDVTTNDKRYIADLDVCQKVLEKRKNKLGENHPDTLRTITNIVFLYIQLGKHTEAIQMYEKVLEINRILHERLEELQLRYTEVYQMYENVLENQRTLHERLEGENAYHSQTVERALNAEMIGDDLQRTYAQEQLEGNSLERISTEGGLPVEVTGLQKCNVLPPPPPPLPPAPPLNPLKPFNWVKLPDAKVQGTVWTELNHKKWHNNMGRELIDEIFSAYRKNVANDGSMGEPQNRTKTLSVIDGHRARNCEILLLKLKMSSEEISKAILSMDLNEQLPIDMIEQLINFIPSDEEQGLLNKHSEDIHSLDRADRFLYEISKIPHYKQRLESLLYKKCFTVNVDDLSSQIASVMEASREVANSARLRKLLELVLAFGNYMNHGSNGNACGFRLVSLNRLADTTSTSVKGITLLHYLVQVIQKQDKDLLKLEEDIAHVRVACKVSLSEMKGVDELMIATPPWLLTASTF